MTTQTDTASAPTTVSVVMGEIDAEQVVNIALANGVTLVARPQGGGAFTLACCSHSSESEVLGCLRLTGIRLPTLREGEVFTLPSQPEKSGLNAHRIVKLTVMRYRG